MEGQELPYWVCFIVDPGKCMDLSGLIWWRSCIPFLVFFFIFWRSPSLSAGIFFRMCQETWIFHLWWCLYLRSGFSLRVSVFFPFICWNSFNLLQLSLSIAISLLGQAARLGCLLFLHRDAAVMRILMMIIANICQFVSSLSISACVCQQFLLPVLSPYANMRYNAFQPHLVCF